MLRVHREKDISAYEKVEIYFQPECMLKINILWGYVISQVRK